MKIFIDIKKKVGNLDIKIESTQELIGILGMSGSGKSMLLKCIAGIETPDEGEIRLDDTILFSSRLQINIPIQKRKVAYLFQNYGLFPHLNVENNIRLVANKKEIKKVMELCRLEGLEKHYPHQLSGGQKQRVAIARILVTSPKMILLDEPFSALDVSLKDDLEMDLFQNLKSFQGITCFVSHNPNEIYRFSQDVAIISEGTLIDFGKKEMIFQYPKTREAARLVGFDNYLEIEPQMYQCFKSSEITVSSQGAYVGVVEDIISDVAYDMVFVKVKNQKIKIKTKEKLKKNQEVRFDFENSKPMVVIKESTCERNSFMLY